jgi:hypothetical protein
VCRSFASAIRKRALCSSNIVESTGEWSMRARYNPAEALWRRWKRGDPTLAGVLIALAIIATLTAVSSLR